MKQYSIRELMRLLRNATLSEAPQEEINMYAIELASKIYVPNCGQSYEDLLDQLGYKNVKKKVKKNERKITENN